MNRYELTRETFGDLDDLWRYIAEDSVDAANRVTDEILDACDLLADRPLMGHTRADLTPRPLLFWPKGKYLIVYRPDSAPIRIVGVFHSARDIAPLLTDRS
jgi:plasmid stabilization system protein ParE